MSRIKSIAQAVATSFSRIRLSPRQGARHNQGLSRDLSFYCAPPTTLQALRRNRVLSFQLRSQVVSLHPAMDPLLSADLMSMSPRGVIYHKLGHRPRRHWTPYRMDLDRLAWRLGSFDGASLAIDHTDDPWATTDTVNGVLADANSFLIRGRLNTQPRDDGTLTRVALSRG